MASSHRSFPILGLLIVALMGAILIAFNQGSEAPPSTSDTPSRTTGIIRGATAAADGSHPADLVACAQSTTEGEKTCAAPGAGASYELSVPPGQYLVSAHRSSTPDIQAFYTDRVNCALPTDCTGQPIVVNVAAGQTLEGINPLDWQVE